MKRSVLIMAICLLVSISVFAQSSECFKYQAVLRGVDGKVLIEKDVSVKLSILKSTINGEEVYSEIHQLTTNAFGLINLNIGCGIAVTGVFTQINWAEDSYYLLVELDIDGGDNYQIMGVSPFLSVPYALHAQTVTHADDADANPRNEIQGLSLNGALLSISDSNYVDLSVLPDSVIDADADSTNELQILTYNFDTLKISKGNALILPQGLGIWQKNGNNILLPQGNLGIGKDSQGSKMLIKGDTTEMLFGVLNNFGDTVFAVYQEGVRINVADNQTKGAGSRGGFAVGGFSSGKGLSNEFLRVTPDSVRVYINNSTKKASGSRGGFAVGGFSSGKETVGNYMYLEPENYFIGHEGGKNLTTGLYNSTLGYQSGLSITQGSENSLIGYQSGYNNSEGSGNLFLGYQTGFSNEFGNYNSFLGYQAGYNNTTGVFNTFLGSFSGYSNTQGNNNTFVGDSTGFNNVNGYENTFIGTGCGLLNTEGYENVFIGNKSGYSNSTGIKNVLVGNFSGYSNTTGYNNIMIGNYSGHELTTGNDNIFIGDSSGYNSNNCVGNTYMGIQSGLSNISGSYNTCLGPYSGYSNTSGSLNTLLGYAAGVSIDSSSNNVMIGRSAGFYAIKSESNVIIGVHAGLHQMQNDVSSESNVIIGHKASFNSIGGNSNVVIGESAGYSNIESYSNVFLGNLAGYNNTTGSDNVFLGYRSGYENTSGRESVFLGWLSGESQTTGLGNVFLGPVAGNSTTTGNGNVFIGMHAGERNVDGYENVVVGSWAANDTLLGNNNVILGHGSGSLATGNENVFIGRDCGKNSDGSQNVFLGVAAGQDQVGSGLLIVENSPADSTEALIYGDFVQNTLRFNSYLALNGNPDTDFDLTIDSRWEAADVKLYGIGDDYNYATIDFVSKDTPIENKWQIGHSKDEHKFKLVNFDGAGWHVPLEVDTLGTLSLLLGGINTGGTIQINRTDSVSSDNEIYFSDYGQIRSSDDAHRIIFDRGNDILELREYGSLVFSSGAESSERTANMVLSNNGTLTLNGSFYPKTDNTFALGSASNRWNEVFATNGVINTSDARLKRNIRNLEYGINEIMLLKPVSFYWKDGMDQSRKVGLVAQDVENVIEEAVKKGNDENETLGINYSELVPVLIKGMQEQQKQIEELRKEIESLKNK